MSFRARLYGSAGRGAGLERDGSRSALPSSPNVERSFSVRDSRRSLTRNEFAKSTKNISTPLGTEEEAEKKLGFALSRTTRKNLKLVFEVLRIAGDCDEEILSGLCGASALSESDLVRLTAIDCDVFKTFLLHHNPLVRRASVNVCAQIAERLWEWFASDTAECVEELESSQQDLRAWCLQLFRAIADRTGDEDKDVSATSYYALDLATLFQEALFERIARHLIPSIGSLVKNCARLRSVSSIRFTSRVLMLALSESGPQGVTDVYRNQQQAAVTIAQAFLELVLHPLVETSEARTGDVPVTAAECALSIVHLLSPWSAYDYGRVKVFCANGALQHLRTLESGDEFLPDSCRRSRKRRWASVLLRAAESAEHLPHKQRIRVLGRCAVVCTQDPLLEETLATCARHIIDIECSDRDALKALIEDERGVLRPVWLGSEKPRHRLAAALLRATSARCPVGVINSDRRLSWLDLSLRVLESMAQCITWGDSSFLVHFAGQMYLDLLAKRTFFPLVLDSPDEIERALAMENFLRLTIEFRLKTIANASVRAGLLSVCERAFCLFPNPDIELGQVLVDAARHLALSSDVLTSEIHPLEPIHPSALTSRGMFVIALGILSHLARTVPALRNGVSAAFGHISTYTTKISAHEHALLEESIRELERTRSLRLGSGTTHQDLNEATEPVSMWSENILRSPEPESITEWPARFEGQRSYPASSEKQLSGGHDPVYIVGRWRLRSDTRMDLILELSNISNQPLHGLDISVSCRGSMKIDIGFGHSIKFFKEIAPGNRTIVKFAMLILEDDFGFAARRGVDIRVELDTDVQIDGTQQGVCSYILPTWWISPGLFLVPRNMPFESFRYIWGHREKAGISKCETIVKTSAEKVVKAFADCSTLACVARSSRSLYMSAQTRDGEQNVLLSMVLQPKSETETVLGIAMRIKPINGTIPIVPGFDIRDFISELVPFLAMRVVWSGAPTWPGTIPANGYLDEADELVSNEASWTTAPSELSLDGQAHPSLHSVMASLQKWKALQT